MDVCMVEISRKGSNCLEQRRWRMQHRKRGGANRRLRNLKEGITSNKGEIVRQDAPGSSPREDRPGVGPERGLRESLLNSGNASCDSMGLVGRQWREQISANIRNVA